MERFEEPPPLPDTAVATETMKHRLKTKAGKAVYAKRKSTIEPVFGIIKAVMGFRQFLLRGKIAVKGEWDLDGALSEVHNKLLVAFRNEPWRRVQNSSDVFEFKEEALQAGMDVIKALKLHASSSSARSKHPFDIYLDSKWHHQPQRKIKNTIVMLHMKKFIISF